MKNRIQKIVFSIKPSGGKLLHTKLIIEDNLIKSCSLTGDFFIYPEESLEKLEDFLTNQKVTNLEKKMAGFIKRRKIVILGWSSKDFCKALMENIDKQI
ncbi:MAG TPA: hypothetical protein ENN31_00195 [Candidatus Vogelbacteria bacterium]|nr:hypothetical protein [Candidatus Vogelbacteria bacterium]